MDTTGKSAFHPIAKRSNSVLDMEEVSSIAHQISSGFKVRFAQCFQGFAALLVFSLVLLPILSLLVAKAGVSMDTLPILALSP